MFFKVLLKDSRAIKLLKACNRFDNSPLHVACERGYLGMISYKMTNITIFGYTHFKCRLWLDVVC